MSALDATNAACRDIDPELWFPVSGNQDGPAKRICFGCSMRQECLDYAIETGQQFGIWGGENLEERQAETRRRNAEGRQKAKVDLAANRYAQALQMRQSGLRPIDTAAQLRVTVQTVEKYLQMAARAAC